MEETSIEKEIVDPENGVVNSESEISEEPEQNENAPVHLSISIKPKKGELISITVTATDNFQDLKYFLAESPQTCMNTCYSLKHNDNIINEFSDVGDVIDIDGSVLEIVDAQYDEKSAKFHVKRMREILFNSNKKIADVSPSLFAYHSYEDSPLPPPEKKNGKTNNKKNKKNGENHSKNGQVLSKNTPDSVKLDTIALDNCSLADFYPNAIPENPSIVKSIVLSGYNPPPGNRKFCGDLFYIEVQTNESQEIRFITASTSGFFVNASTPQKFNGQSAEKSYKSHTLYELLCSISPSFQKNFDDVILSNTADLFPLALIQPPQPLIPWLQVQKEHSYDLNRAEESLISSYEPALAETTTLRDWNEEFQVCREFPSSTMFERFARDRAIIRINTDFVEAATRAAMAIVHNTVAPINPLEEPRQHMYIYNNIFFSRALDGRDTYAKIGGDVAAYTAANNDLKGVRAFFDADIPGLSVLATAIIDYKGHRLIAQSIIPGILHRESVAQVVYGNYETPDEKKICTDPEFHELMQKVSEKLYMTQTTVKDNEGNVKELHGCVDSKGIIGTDKRKYMLELLRTTPRDSNFEGPEHSLCTLRPELIFHYVEYKQKQKNAVQIQSLQTQRLEKEQKEKEENEKKKIENENKNENDKSIEESKKEENEPKKPEEITLEDLGFVEEQIDISWDVNLLIDNIEFAGTEDQKKERIALISVVSTFLKDTLLPAFVEEMQQLLYAPIDGVSLKTLMHERGINIRYLGMLLKLSHGIPALKELFTREMITRVLKHQFNALIKVTEDSQVCAAVAHFLNCFLGNSPIANDGQDSPQNLKKKKKKNGYSPIRGKGDIFSQTNETVWASIIEEVQKKFDTELLLENTQSLRKSLSTLPLLKSFCEKVGIQIVANDFNFNLQAPFDSSDILSMFPKVKHINPRSQDGRDLLEAGKTVLSEGRLDLAYELLTEAISIFHQVAGPMSADVSTCFGDLAAVLFNTGNFEQAIEHKKKATIIDEKIFGCDSAAAAYCYQTLGLFCEKAGRLKESLGYFNRCFYLGQLINSKNHTDTQVNLVNIANIRTELGEHKKAIDCLLKSLKLHEKTYGSNNLPYAGTCHSLALAYSQLGEFREALKFEKINYSSMKEKLGEKDPRAVESSVWLQQLTSKAVTQVKDDRQTARVGKGVEQTLPQNPRQLPTTSSLPLPDLLRYINGQGPAPRGIPSTGRRPNSVGSVGVIRGKAAGRGKGRK